MPYKILTVDTNLCTGCRLCELVCSLNKEGECNPRKARIRVLKIDQEGFDFPLTCQHCGDAPCKEVCPVSALTRNNDTGAIVLNEDTCIGCRACTLACPFGVIGYDPPKGVSRKCDLCEGDPKCVLFCETHALRYEKTETAETRKYNDVLKKLIRPLHRSKSDSD